MLRVAAILISLVSCCSFVASENDDWLKYLDLIRTKPPFENPIIGKRLAHLPLLPRQSDVPSRLLPKVPSEKQLLDDSKPSEFAQKLKHLLAQLDQHRAPVLSKRILPIKGDPCSPLGSLIVSKRVVSSFLPLDGRLKNPCNPKLTVDPLKDLLG